MEDVIIRVAVFVDDISGELLIEPWAEAAVTFLATDDGLSLIAIVGVKHHAVDLAGNTELGILLA